MGWGVGKGVFEGDEAGGVVMEGAGVGGWCEGHVLCEMVIFIVGESQE